MQFNTEHQMLLVCLCSVCRIYCWALCFHVCGRSLDWTSLFPLAFCPGHTMNVPVRNAVTPSRQLPCCCAEEILKVCQTNTFALMGGFFLKRHDHSVAEGTCLLYHEFASLSYVQQCVLTKKERAFPVHSCNTCFLTGCAGRNTSWHCFCH